MSKLHFVLNALLALGVALNLGQGLAMLLGPVRLDALVSWWDRQILKLQRVRPIAQLEPLVTGKRRTRILLIGVVEFLIGAAADALVDYWDGVLDDVGSFGMLLCAAAVAVSVAVLPLLDRLGEPELMGWMLEDERFWPFLRRFIQFGVIGGAAIAAYQGVVWGAGVLLGMSNPFDTVTTLAIHHVRVASALIGVALVIAAPALVYYSVVIQLGSTVLLLAALAWVAAGSLKVIQRGAAAVFHRYQGVWLAAGLATTMALFIFRLAVA